MGDKPTKGRRDSKQKGEQDDPKEKLPGAQGGGLDKVYSAFIKTSKEELPKPGNVPISKAGIRFTLPDRIMRIMKGK